MKPLKIFIEFLATLYFGQWIITLFLLFIVSKSSFRFSQLYHKTTKMDYEILCIGNSRGVNSFYSPYINNTFSLKSYNLSYNGLNLSIEKILLEDYLENHNKPKAVFIEVSNVFNSNSKPYYESFNMYSSKSKRINEKIKETDLNTYILSATFPLYRYNNEFLFRSLFYMFKADQNWINRYKITEGFNQKVLEMPAKNFSCNKKDLMILRQIVVMLKKKDVNVYLYLAPYLPNYLSKINNLSFQIAYIEKEIGVKVINLSRSLSKPDFFSDRVHINEEGAKLVANLLIRSSNPYKNKN